MSGRSMSWAWPKWRPVGLRLGQIVALAFTVMMATGCDITKDERLLLLYADYDADDNVVASDLIEHKMLATQMGLVTFDYSALVRPGIAERWVTSDDGLSYIFRIGDYSWDDGKTVVAQDVATLLKARLRALRKDDLGSELAAISDIIARTDEILEIQLSTPRPRLLDLLAGPKLTLARKGEGLGPMTMLADMDEGQLLYLPSSPKGTDSIDSRPVMLTSRPAAQAIAAYRADMADMLFGLRYASLPLLRAADIPADEFIKDPAMGFLGLKIKKADGALSYLKVRQAIAMSIDRPHILAAFDIPDWREMTSISPTQLTNRGDVNPRAWLSLDMEQRVERARQAVADAGLNEEERVIGIYIPEHGPGATMIFELLREQMSAIGLNLQHATEAGADVEFVDMVAGFDDPLWYMTELGCARQIICDAEVDDMVEEARKMLSLEQRRALLADAENKLTPLASFIPIAEPLRFSLVREANAGLQPNFRALHPLQYLGATPDR